MPEDKNNPDFGYTLSSNPKRKHQPKSEAELDKKSARHYQWMMGQERPELSEYEEGFCSDLEVKWEEEYRVEQDIRELELGPCGDVASKQERVEKLKGRLARIGRAGSPDAQKAISYAQKAWQKNLVTLDEMIFMVIKDVDLSRKYAHDTIRKWIQRHHPDHEPGKRGRKGTRKLPIS
jgi:hypothetical protein